MKNNSEGGWESGDIAEERDRKADNFTKKLSLKISVVRSQGSPSIFGWRVQDIKNIIPTDHPWIFRSPVEVLGAIHTSDDTG